MTNFVDEDKKLANNIDLDTTSIPLIKPDSISTSNSINEKAPILPKKILF